LEHVLKVYRRPPGYSKNLVYLKETAINIAFSCGLLTEYMREVSIIDGKDEKEVEVQLKDTIRRMQNAKVPQVGFFNSMFSYFQVCCGNL